MKEEKINCKLLKEKDKINNDLACRLIFKIRGQSFAVDFVVLGLLEEITIGSSGFVDKLEQFEDFEKYARREVGE